MTTPRPRPALDSIPAYKAGKPPAPGAGPCVQAVEQREPVPAAARRARARGRGGRDDQPLSRHGRQRAARSDRGQARRRRRSRSPPGPVRWPCSTTCCRRCAPRATRSSTPGGRSRLTRSRSGSPARRRCQVPLDADARHDLEAMLAADHDRHQGRRRLYAQQPDRAGGARRRAAPLHRGGAARTCWSRSTRPTASSSPTPRRRRRARARRRARQRRRAADLLQGLRTGRAPGRVRRRAAAGSPRRSASARCPSGSRTSPRRPRSPRSESEAASARPGRELVAERERVVAALREQGWNVPDAQGNFVWFGLGDATLRLRRGLRGGGRQRAPVRRRRRPRQHRGDRGQRPSSRRSPAASSRARPRPPERAPAARYPLVTVRGSRLDGAYTHRPQPTPPRASAGPAVGRCAGLSGTSRRGPHATR